ncbi:MFS transporter [Saccharomonospora xinjiangensis]|uniref:MFS transporter n=1 Tax=Saccharomonospora xinjiangensis TaxID=75294 RepID=UPI00106FDB27|nr:MFS transporter [Saccharomonospora xinjiangensis]
MTSTRTSYAERRTGGHWASTVTVALIATVTVMPGFTVGALAGAMEHDLRASPSTLGLAMSAFYAATALGSPFTKRLAARLPVPWVLGASAVAASAVLFTVSRTSDLAVLVSALVVGGFTNGLVQPAAGRLIAARTPPHRQSLAAGLLGAALGAATLVPGLLVALALQPYGWRTAMAVAGAIALVPVAFVGFTRIPPSPLPVHRNAGGDGARPPNVGRVLVLWSLAAALSAIGNNAVASYFVQLGTQSGTSVAVAGNLLSLSAILAIAVRIVTGALADRTPHRNPTVITGMMLTGAAGLALIAIGTPATFVLGAVLAFSAGWGWTGLLLSTTLRLVPGRAENAGHTIQVGVYTGATIAPFAFGAISGALTFSIAALAAAAAGLAGAAAMAAGARELRGRQRSAPPSSQGTR